MSRSGVAVPYIIAILLGVAVIGLVGYWFISQEGTAIKTGTQAECATLKFNYCKGFVKTWDATDTTKCGFEPKCVDGVPSQCGNAIKEPGELCEKGDKIDCGGGITVSCKNDCSGYNICPIVEE